MSVTIEQLSRQLNLSVSTVSKALNGYPDVAEETRQRVLAVARDLGYEPSAAARNLRRGRSDKIGFVFNSALPFISDYFAEVIVGAALAAATYGNNIVLYTNEGDSPDSLRQLARNREVDGLILVWNHVPLSITDMLFESGIPFIVLGRRIRHPFASYIAPDNYAGARELMNHLLALGHRRIGFTARPAMGLTHEDRYRAYCDALEEAGIALAPELVVQTEVEPRSGYYAAARLLDLAEPPTAIFAFHDFVAIDAQQAIHDRGLRIPEDIALAGFDGLRISLVTSPPITTVRQPLETIGRESVAALLNLINDENHPPIQKVLPVELKVRESTAGRKREPAKETF